MRAIPICYGRGGCTKMGDVKRLRQELSQKNNVLVCSCSQAYSSQQLIWHLLNHREINNVNVLHINVNGSVQGTLSKYRNFRSFPLHLAIISASDTMRTQNMSRPDAESVLHYPYITTVDGPTDLQGIGKITATLLDRWTSEEAATMINFDSISDLHTYCDKKTISRFCKRFSKLVKTHDARCYYHYNAPPKKGGLVGLPTEYVDRVVVIDNNGRVTIKDPSVTNVAEPSGLVIALKGEDDSRRTDKKSKRRNDATSTPHETIEVESAHELTTILDETSIELLATIHNEEPKNLQKLTSLLDVDPELARSKLHTLEDIGIVNIKEDEGEKIPSIHFSYLQIEF